MILPQFKTLLVSSALLLALARTAAPGVPADPPAGLQVGAAAAEIAADDSMAIAGSIFPRYVKGQEAPIRAAAVVISAGGNKLCIVSCDVLKLGRVTDDAAAHEIESRTGIPAQNVLITATHTHSAPSTLGGHSIAPDPVFSHNVQDAIVKAAVEAAGKLENSRLYFALGSECTVGQNSRLLLSDGTIYWVGPHDDAVRPTGPFDPNLPVFAFKSPAGALQALMFNHSTHSIGSLENKRSPAFYGLAAQQLEKEWGGTALYLNGASASTHVVAPIPVEERIIRIKNAVKEAYAEAQPRDVTSVDSVKEEFTFHVRHFDEAKEDQAVSYYCNKRIAKDPQATIDNFRHERAAIAPHQGEARKTWLQVMRIGDIALVGVPSEYFAKLGMDIKRRSPFRYTYIAELANDYTGYVPDRAAFALGGYQVWTGLHAFVERGTGEAMEDEVVRMLNESYRKAGLH